MRVNKYEQGKTCDNFFDKRMKRALLLSLTRCIKSRMLKRMWSQMHTWGKRHPGHCVIYQVEPCDCTSSSLEYENGGPDWTNARKAEKHVPSFAKLRLKGTRVHVQIAAI